MVGVTFDAGSRNLRVGLASNESPLIVPHLIAWRTITEQSETENIGPSSKGAVVEGKVECISLPKTMTILLWTLIVDFYSNRTKFNS